MDEPFSIPSTPSLASLSHGSAVDSGLGASADNCSDASPAFGGFACRDEPVAVVGMACRFADANTPLQLWEMVRRGQSGRSEIPQSRWNAKAWHHPHRGQPGTICTTSGHFLDDVAVFDAPFFSMSPKEAAAMDPMQRLGLEVAYEAFENAGIPMTKLARSATSVYSGVMTNDYQMLAEGDPHRLGVNSAAGTGKSMLSNRISWFFDLVGPSLTLDTACSSSLYALHLACQSLRSGESRQALVTGHNLMLHPTFFSQLSSMQMVSPDGVSHSFDAAANGYGRGEGIAAVVLKSVSAAVADGDVIRAVIRATGVGSDGKTPGITVPSGDAQADLIRKVYDSAGLDWSQTAYFEAHGTGTSVGDPIEVSAISATIGAARRAQGLGPLFVGSVKTNIGHTEGCAGLAGVIKTILCLEQGAIPPIAGLGKLNPSLGEAMESGNLSFPTGDEVMAWPSTGLRRASVNSFGFGGANAHAVLDDARHYLGELGFRGARHMTVRRLGERLADEGNDGDEPLLFVTSSFDRSGLGRMGKLLGTFVSEDKTTSLESLAYILGTRRTAHAFRSFAVASTKQELASQLSQQVPEFLCPHTVRPLVFLFTGQGAQRRGMAAELLEDDRFPVFKHSIARSQACLASLGCKWDLVELLTKDGDGDSDGDSDAISDPSRSQPACTAVQLGLVQLLAHWGVMPSAVIGHSSGEMVAAYAAGAVSHEDAMRVAYYRGLFSAQLAHRLTSEGHPGAMLAVGMPEKSAGAFLDTHDPAGNITVACINSPRSVTLSGVASAIADVEAALRADGHFARAIRTGGVAYHSPCMETVGGDFINALTPFLSNSNPTREPLTVPMYSSVTEAPISDASVLSSAEYWHLNMKSPVRFAGALRNLLSSGHGFQHSTVLEIGPSKTLAGPVGQIMAEMASPNKKTFAGAAVPYLSMLSAGQDSRTSVLTAAGTLWAIGLPVDLSKANGLSCSQAQTLRLKELPMLPPYAWNHTKSYWHDTTALQSRTQPRLDLIGVPKMPQNPFAPEWHHVLRLRELHWLADHAVAGTALFPAAGYLAMAIEALRTLAREQGVALHGVELADVHFETGLAFGRGEDSDDDDGTGVVLCFKPDPDQNLAHEFTIYASSASTDGWRRLARGSIEGVLVPDAESIAYEWQSVKRPQLERVAARAAQSVDVPAFFSHLGGIGLTYGPMFRGLKQIRTVEGSSEAYGELLVTDTRSTMPGGHENHNMIHPATLDGLLQLVFAALQSPSGQGSMATAAMPVSLRRVFIGTCTPTTAGARLVGIATASRIEHEASDGKDYFRGSITYASPGMERPSVIVDDVVLQFLPPSSTSAESQASHVGSEAVQQAEKFYRTAEMVWKTDVDQSFARWKDLLLAVPSVSDRCAMLADWFSHKRAHARALFVAPFAADIGSGGQLAQFAACVTLTSLDSWKQQVGHDKSGSEKFDLVICQAGVCGSDADIVGRLGEICAPGGWIVVLEDYGSQEDSKVLPALAANFGRLPASKVLRLSETSAQLMAVADPDDSSGNTNKEAILIGRGKASRATSDLLSAQLSSLGYRVVSHATLDEAAATASRFKGKTIISLLEVGAPLVHNWSAPELDCFRKVVSSGAAHMLWVSTGGLIASPSSETSLQYAPTVGLLRTIRAEYAHLALPHLDLSPETLSERPADAVGIIIETLNLSSSSSPPSRVEEASQDTTTPESEFAECSGRLLIPRVVACSEADMYLATELSGTQKSPIHLQPVDRVQGWECVEVDDNGDTPCLVLRDFGVSKDARWLLQHDRDHPPRSARETALIRTACATIQENKKAGVVRHGLHLAVAQQVIGFVSRSNDSGLAVGDAVLVTTPGPLRPYIAQHTRKGMVRLPLESVSHKSLPAAAYWLGPLATAMYVLSVSLSLRGGKASVVVDTGDDSVLEHALVRVALSCPVLGVTKVFLIHDDGDGPLSMYIRNNKLVTVISRLTRPAVKLVQCASLVNGGVAAVVSTKLPRRAGRLERLMDALSSERGCIIDLQSASATTSVPLNTRIRSLGRGQLSWDDPEHGVGLYKALAETLSCMERGQLVLPHLPKPVISASDTRRLAQVCMPTSSGERANRTVVTFLAHEPVTIHRQLDLRSASLDPTGTYIIAGGLGALGLPLAHMLRDLGARHLVLLSRSGNANLSPEQAAEIAKLKASGCRVEAMACDITSEEAVDKVSLSLNRSGRQLRGLIQSAMVLADNTFSTMNFAQWQAATAPKVQGSWNLHRLASSSSSSVDFFILLSSVSGIIGNSAQANYCAGNTFEDALARHRRTKGLPAVSLNVGLVSDSVHYGRGSMAAFKNVGEYLAVFSHLAPVIVSTAEMLAAVKMVVTGDSSTFASSPPQLIVGFSPHVPRGGHDLMNQWPMDCKFDHRTALPSAVTSWGDGQQDATRSSKKGPSASKRLAAAKDPEQARLVVEELLKGKLAQAMSIELDSIEEEKSLSAYGVDSLKAVEVRNWIMRDLKSDLSMFEILRPMPMSKLALGILKSSRLVDWEALGLNFGAN